MKKFITYVIFVIATALVVVMFVTAKDYTQLTAAVILYPAIAYLALRLFPRKEHEISFAIPMSEQEKEKPVSSVQAVNVNGSADVADVDRRTFLKLVGVAGISVFLLSIFSKKAQLPFFGKIGGNESLALTNAEGKQIDPAEKQPLDGYQISEMADGIVAYYGFINKDGAWFIMREDTQSNSFRYAKGNASFPKGWLNRESLKYDYFYNI